MSFIKENLLLANGYILHCGEVLGSDEENIHTYIQNLVVVTWLRLVHSDLPSVIKQCYDTGLKSNSQALKSQL